MQTIIAGPLPWKQITSALRSKGRRQGAVAFLGADAPKLLSGFRTGDRLVVNASLESVRSGATSPYALEALMSRGVEVFNSPNLHAKIFVTSTTAVIGSANASATSQRSLEAAVITTQASLVRAATTLVEELIDPATPVTHEMLEVWKQEFGSRRVALPGVTGPSAESKLLPRGRHRTYLVPTEDDDLTDDERAAGVAGVAHDPEFPIEVMQVDDNGFEPDSLIFRVSTDGQWLLQPAVVYGSPADIEGRENGRFQLLRTHRKHRSHRISKAYQDLPAETAQRVAKIVDRDATVSISTKHANALLGLWKLP